MKQIVHFSVRGGLKEDLLQKAQEEYQRFTEDPSAELPQNTIFTFTSETVEISGERTVSITSWELEVYFSLSMN